MSNSRDKSIPANPKSLAWDTIGGLYWNCGYDGGPSVEDIADYSRGIEPGQSIGVVGASTRSLIRHLITNFGNVTVLDFSEGMIDALRAELNDSCGFEILDITRRIPERLSHRFDHLIADRLLNRFIEEEILSALENMLRMVCPGGDIRVSVRLGLYERDLPLIEAGRRAGTLDNFFDERTMHIDYSKCGGILDDLMPDHGNIPRNILMSFYRQRGTEKRFIADDFERYFARMPIEYQPVGFDHKSFGKNSRDRLYTISGAHK